MSETEVDSLVSTVARVWDEQRGFISADASVTDHSGYLSRCNEEFVRYIFLHSCAFFFFFDN